MLDFAPGQTIRCTIQAEPAVQDRVDTIARLMRRDPDIARSLRKGQRLREQNMIVYVRGNRDWYKRAKCGKVAIVKKGNSWTMPYTPDLARDIESVKTYLTIERA
ncbi:MAG: hypothetical protein R3B68_08100 [Phycisphaerales bacterium]